MKKIVIGMQIVALLSSFSAFSQATYSQEMIDRDLKEKKMREDVYKASEIKNAEIAKQERRKKALSDSLFIVKNLEEKKINEDKEAQYNAEKANQEKEAKGNKIRENSASEDKNKENFVFDKIALERLEKVLKYSDYYDEETKILYSSLLPIDSTGFKSNSDGTAKYEKISSFLSTEKFVPTSWSIGNDSYSVIKNIKTQQLYAIHTFVRYWKDYSAGSIAGHNELIKYIPIPLSAEKQELLNRYKALIKSGQANTIVLKNIQNKCLTKGYFDEHKITNLDKQTWNKNFKALKFTYGKLSDINQFEDKDNQAQNKLSISELGTLENINIWLSNFSIIE